MNRLAVTNPCACPRNYARRGGHAWRLIAVFMLGGLLFSLSEAIAQTCEDDNPWQAAALIDQIRTSCERNNIPYTVDIYGLASVADKEALPALRKLAAWPTDKGPGAECQGWVMAARAALAKLGDEDYRTGLDLASLSFVGDDRALLALIEFLITHDKDPAMLQDFGDYQVDQRDGILQDIDTIRRRRRAPDLPVADYSDVGITRWQAYLEKHKGQQLTFPAYPNVDDPYLRCLARRVDWGYPDAILAIAATGSDAARRTLLQFPRLEKPEAMGFAASSPFTMHWADIQGNLQVALAQLGDDEMFNQIVAELSGATASESVRKLEFIGGKRAVDALVKALDVPEEVVQKARAQGCGNNGLAYCHARWRDFYKPIWGTIAYDAQIDRESCFGETFHGCLLYALGKMVKDPPVAPGADATPQNIGKWKEWWAKNRERAGLVVRPAQRFE
jgi:HEAT repeat protein